ncbi:MAG: ParB/RepB/Spo0J family partition protein [Gemmatimonadota bacterium]|nr:ParB/RepB/Spo0J family partition protein [Gemmatimonadota bacterium]
MTEKVRLGRGLEALLGPVSREQAEASGALRELAVTQIRPNPFQPRRSFDETALAELTASIKASGLLQPLVVRANGSSYEIIAGERRWRAVQRLGWSKVSVVVKEADDKALLTLALIENLQRDDLTPIDEATAYQRLMDEFTMPQAEVARLVGKDRSTVSNSLRLLKLPTAVQTMLEERSLTEGHARALLALADADEIVRVAKEAVGQGWSVRQTEARVRGETLETGLRNRIRKAKPAARTAAAEIRRVEDALRQRLGTDVRVTARRKGRGAITVSYYSNDDLSRLLELVLGAPFDG